MGQQRQSTEPVLPDPVVELTQCALGDEYVATRFCGPLVLAGLGTRLPYPGGKQSSVEPLVPHTRTNWGLVGNLRVGEYGGCIVCGTPKNIFEL